MSFPEEVVDPSAVLGSIALPGKTERCSCAIKNSVALGELKFG